MGVCKSIMVAMVCPSEWYSGCSCIIVEILEGSKNLITRENWYYAGQRVILLRSCHVGHSRALLELRNVFFFRFGKIHLKLTYCKHCCLLLTCHQSVFIELQWYHVVKAKVWGTWPQQSGVNKYRTHLKIFLVVIESTIIHLVSSKISTVGDFSCWNGAGFRKCKSFLY